MDKEIVVYGGGRSTGRNMALDFVMVRFCTRPHSFMRFAHHTIKPWLLLRNIQWTEGRSHRHVMFELPEELKIYEEVTPELANLLSPLALEIKRLLMSVSFMAMGKVRQPLSEIELRLMADAGITIIL